MKTRSLKPLYAVATVALLGVLLAMPLSQAFAIYEPANGRTIVINPATLRSILVRNNYGVLESLNQVHQAKDQVAISRGQLLPRLNLGAVISGIASGPGFALSSMSFLLPFLIPTNWANLHRSEDLLESQKIGYRLIELNNYASAYSIYVTMQGDAAVRETLVAEFNDFVGVRDYLIKQQKFVGNVAQEDIDRADADVNTASANISATDEMLVHERALLRQALGVPLTTNIVLSDAKVSVSPAEDMAVTAVARRIQGIAPENFQLTYLLKAAGEVKFSKQFAWFSGSSLDVGKNDNGNLSFNKLSIGSQFSIGFDYVPQINLAEDNIQYIKIQGNELLQQEAQLAESTIESIRQAKLQIASLTTAQTEELSVFRAEFRKYTLGQTDLLNVLDAERTAATAGASRAKAVSDLDNLRVTLHRELLTDEFQHIPGCRIRSETEELDKKNAFGRFFAPSKFTISIDQACAPNL